MEINEDRIDAEVIDLIGDISAGVIRKIMNYPSVDIFMDEINTALMDFIVYLGYLNMNEILEGVANITPGVFMELGVISVAEIVESMMDRHRMPIPHEFAVIKELKDIINSTQNSMEFFVVMGRMALRSAVKEIMEGAQLHSVKEVRSMIQEAIRLRFDEIGEVQQESLENPLEDGLLTYDEEEGEQVIVNSECALHRAALCGTLRPIKVNMLINSGISVNTLDNHGFTPLHYAVMTGNLRLITLLVAKEANVNVGSSKYNQTPLHWAARLGKVDCIRKLCKLGADPKLLDSTLKMATPLHTAAIHGQVQAALSLLQIGIDVDIEDGLGYTPLYYAIEMKHTEMLTFLIKNGAKVNLREDEPRLNDSPLHSAVEEGSLEIMEILLQNGARIDYFCHATTQTPLHWAALEGNTECLELMCKYGGNAFLNTRDGDGNQAIHLAILEEHSDAVKWLIEKGVSVNDVNNVHMTPLHLAVELGNIDIVAALLQGSPVVDARLHGKRALDLAASSGELEILKLLIRHGSNVNSEEPRTRYTALHFAAKHNKIDCLEELHRNGGNILVGIEPGEYESLLITAVRDNSENATAWLLRKNFPLDSRMIDGTSALHEASRRGFHNLVTLLLDYGAFINIRDKGHYTPLHYAAKEGHYNVIDTLIKKGANPNADTKQGLLPVHYTVCTDNTDCLKVFAESGYDLMIPTKNESKDLVIHFAACFGSNNCIRWLLDRGIPIESRNSWGASALHYAIWKENYKTSKLLLEKGADVNARLTYWKSSTSLHVAVRKRDIHLAELLLSFGANVNIRTSSSGQTPLHCAVHEGNEQMVQLLVQNGADVNIQDCMGVTPVGVARLRNMIQIEKILNSVSERT